MLMSLGQFVFDLNNLNYQTLERSTSWRFARNNRVGKRASSQFLGQGDDTITLSGWITPEICCKAASLDKLRKMGNSGEPYVLVSGTGKVFGLFEITSLTETQTHLWPNGEARKIEFSLSLHHVDDDQAQRVSLVTSSEQVTQ